MATFEKTLVLHVGTDKTGTTSLQIVLSKNEDVLSKNGVYYAKTGREEFYQHHLLFAPICEQGETVGFPARKSWDENLSDLSDEIASRDETKIIISSEILSWAVDFTQLYKLKALFQTVTVVVYLRRQDYYVESKYEQSIKSLGCCDEIDSETFHIPDYFQMLSKWAEFMGGPEDLIVRPYESGQLYKGSLYEDFWHNALAVDFGDDYSRPDKLQSNPGLTRDALEFQRLLNTIKHRKGARFLEGLHAYSLSESAEVCEPFFVKGLLSPAQRLEILNKAEGSNQNVARELLKRDDGKLFFDDPPDLNSEWQPYPGLTAEKTLTIAKFVYAHNFCAKSTPDIFGIVDLKILALVLRNVSDATNWAEKSRQDLYHSFSRFLDDLDLERDAIVQHYRHDEREESRKFRHSQSHHGVLLDYQNKELSKILIKSEDARNVNSHQIDLIEAQRSSIAELDVKQETFLKAQDHMGAILEKQSIELNKLHSGIAELGVKQEAFLKTQNHLGAILEKQNIELNKLHLGLKELGESEHQQMELLAQQDQSMAADRQRMAEFLTEFREASAPFWSKLKMWLKR